jgi:uncharacterized protein YoxC
MSEIVLKMLLDVSVAGLLAATIFYCIKLNTRIKLLQDSKSELAQLIQQFDESTQQAVASIQEIQRASRKIGENIQTKLDKANYLANDLEFMIERANKTADRIEQQISHGRGSNTNTNANAAASATTRNTTAREDARPSPAATEMKARAAAPQTMSSPSQEKSADKKGIEAMMERISELKGGTKSEASDTRPQQAQRPMARLRSKAEQDLLQALKRDGKA